MYQTKVVEKIKTRILCSINFSPQKLCHLCDNVGKTQQALLCFHCNSGYTNVPVLHYATYIACLDFSLVSCMWQLSFFII